MMRKNRTRFQTLLSRRKILQLLPIFGFATTSLILYPSRLQAQANQDKQNKEKAPWQKEMEQVLVDKKPTEARVSIDLPDLASHHNRIPFSVTIDMPITPHEYVSSLYVYATKHDPSLIAHVSLSSLSGQAKISSTLRLQQDQTLVALAKTNEGKFFIGRRQVKLIKQQ